MNICLDNVGNKTVVLGEHEIQRGKPTPLNLKCYR